MLPKIICIIIVFSTFSTLCKASAIPERNETSLVPLLYQLSELKVLKESEVQLLREDIRLLKTDVERQKEREVVQESSIQSIKEQLERLETLISGQAKKSYLRNCNEAESTGIHDILIPNFSSEPFIVACDAESRGGGWTIILRRLDGSVNFNRNWNAYKRGFGDLNGEFFLGLDKIHALTAERNQELLVLLEDKDGDEAFEKYDAFAIGDEEEKYILHKVGKASGTAGDSLGWHRGKKFSTFDRDNDIGKENCAVVRTGGWWYGNCHQCKLTGTYDDNTEGMGINWIYFRDSTISLKAAVMMIRPKM
ncbi:hypothetical protein ACLKA6_013669 [Drosophila palustris]